MLTEMTLRAEHSELASLAGQLLQAISAQALDVDSVGRLRWKMTRIITVHLAKEDKLLYPRLMQSPVSGVAETAARFQREMGGLSSAYRAYLDAWTADRIVAEPAFFGVETRTVMSALMTRVRRENRELYPMLGGTRGAVPSKGAGADTALENLPSAFLTAGPILGRKQSRW